MQSVAIQLQERLIQPDDLIQRMQRGDVDAFEALYRKHVGRVYALCRRLCGDPARAEELTQDAFARAWQHRQSSRPGAAYTGWLCRIAINVALTDARSRMRRERKEVPAREGEGPIGEVAGPVAAPRTAHALDLERAIAGLPEGARRVFVLHDVEGYRHEEIAELMGLAVGTTKAQLHRARRLLREALSK